MECTLPKDLQGHLPESVGAVLLAAGQGSRMGNQPKSLLRLNGVSLIDLSLTALREAAVNNVVVVTGFYYDQIEPRLKTSAVRIARNPNPGEGQPGSVRLGLETLGHQFSAVLVMLCDQPLLSAEDLQTLIKAFQQRDHGEIVVPTVHGSRGNPVVFSGAVIREILAQDPAISCRAYMDRHPELVSFYETDNDHFVTDVDTLDDIFKFNQTRGVLLELPETVNHTAATKTASKRDPASS